MHSRNLLKRLHLPSCSLIRMWLSVERPVRVHERHVRTAAVVLQLCCSRRQEQEDGSMHRHRPTQHNRPLVLASASPSGLFSWRRRMGVEPTRDGDYRPADGFEDREAHRDPSASSILYPSFGL